MTRNKNAVESRNPWSMEELWMWTEVQNDFNILKQQVNLPETNK